MQDTRKHMILIGPTIGNFTFDHLAKVVTVIMFFIVINTYLKRISLRICDTYFSTIISCHSLCYNPSVSFLVQEHPLLLVQGNDYFAGRKMVKYTILQRAILLVSHPTSPRSHVFQGYHL